MKQNQLLSGLEIPSIDKAIESLVRLIHHNGVKVDNIAYVYGMPLMGTITSTLLSKKFNKPLLLKDTTGSQNYYEFNMKSFTERIHNELTPLIKSVDNVVATEPFSIVVGILIAQMIKKPFYVVHKKITTHIRAGEKDIVTGGLLISKMIAETNEEDVKGELRDKSGIDIIRTWRINNELYPGMINPKVHNDFVGKNIFSWGKQPDEKWYMKELFEPVS